MPICRIVLLCLVAASLVCAGQPKAGRLYAEGLRAERTGDIVRAYLLYSQAAALDPTDQRYWVRAQSLESMALAKQAQQKALAAAAAAQAKGEVNKLSSTSETARKLVPLTGFTEEDLADLRRLRPPPELKPRPGRQSLDLRGNAKTVFEQATSAYGLDAVFDGDYQAGPSTLHIQLDDVDYRQALHAVEAATGSFVFPLSDRLIMVVKDTQQKRVENEPTASVTVEIPGAMSVQDAQELGRAVQQTMDILKLAVDPNRRLVLIKDRISKLRPAQALFEQLSRSRPEVMVEMRFMQVDRVSSLSYGALPPTQFPITWLGGSSSSPSLLALSRVFLGSSTLGLAIASANILASTSRSSSKLLLDSHVRALDGTAATFHVGSRYPIMTGETLGISTATSGVLPTVNFEDLGLSMKVTPHVHGMDEVSLDVEAEFKVLGSESLNGIPYISNRKLQSKVRIRNGEWAVISGLVDASDTNSVTEVPGLGSIPYLGKALRQNGHDKQSSEVLVLMRPVLLSPPADQFVQRTVWIGSETRLDIPL